MHNGLIVKLIGGLYTVVDEDDDKRYEIKPRGKFRHLNISPKVGDRVTFNSDVILEVKERHNDLQRPPICNVDQALIVNSAKEPDFSFNLLDKFLTIIEYNDVKPIIVITKIDLLSKKEFKKLKSKISYYQTFYKVYYISNVNGYGIRKVKKIFKNRITVIAGQTGAGKSSFLNSLSKELNLKTNEISKALGRGKHTTRHTELLNVRGGLIADTPGFSKLDLVDIEKNDLASCFIDFDIYRENCKYSTCIHNNEPDCAVKDAVDSKKILHSRYTNYIQFYKELENKKVKY